LIAAENVEGAGGAFAGRILADIEADMPAALALEDDNVAERRSALRNRRAERRPFEGSEIEARRIALGALRSRNCDGFLWKT
jgi:hypothetical protein